MRCLVCNGADAHPFQRVEGRDYWRCPHCQATFLSPEQMPDRATELGQYQLHENDPADPGYRGFLARLAEPLMERLAPASAGLDYGCGPGPALAAMLRKAGYHMNVYDPLFFDDVEALNGRYDFVTCTEVVEHFHRPAAAFEKLDSLLKPGGWLGIMTMFQTDDAAFARWHYRRDPTHVVFYRPATFEAIARRFGWCLEIPRPNVVLLQKPLPSA